MPNGKDYLAMSDEDFLKLPVHATGEVEEPSPAVVPEPEVPTPVVTEEPTEVIEPPAAVEPEVPVVPEAEKPVVEQTSEEKEAAEKAAAEAGDPAKPEGEEDKAAVDYAAFYNRIVAPLKANGKQIEIKSEDDVIRLMQMGAGFGRKMQEIQPHLKTLRFMEANNLLTVGQEQLKFLVDLNNKNPDAIKKLVKDAGIDPLDFNNEEEVKYQSSIPDVTDQQVVFREAIDNIVAQDGGSETIKACLQWDAPSQQALMNDPQLLDVIHEQRTLGIYDRIMTEVDRQKALGKIPHTTPAIAAYKQVGDYLRDTNGFADLVQEQKRPATEQVAPAPTPQLLATRAAAPKPSVTNNDKAKAAAASRTTPKAAQVLINPLAMSDEEFKAKYGNSF